MFTRGLKIALGAAALSCALALFSADTAKAQYVYAGAGYAPAYYGGYYAPTYVVRTVRYYPAPCYGPVVYPAPVVYGAYPAYGYGYGFGFSLNIGHVDGGRYRYYDGHHSGDWHRGGGGYHGGYYGGGHYGGGHGGGGHGGGGSGHRGGR